MLASIPCMRIASTVAGRSQCNYRRLLILHTYACVHGLVLAWEMDQQCLQRVSHTQYSMQCREGVKSVGLLLPSNDSFNKRERRLTSRPVKLTRPVQGVSQSQSQSQAPAACMFSWCGIRGKIKEIVPIPIKRPVKGKSYALQRRAAASSRAGGPTSETACRARMVGDASCCRGVSIGGDDAREHSGAPESCVLALHGRMTTARKEKLR